MQYMHRGFRAAGCWPVAARRTTLRAIRYRAFSHGWAFHPNLLALHAAQGLAAWLGAQPQLGVDVFARGAPEWVGTALAASYQVDVVGFLWASMALFDDGARVALGPARS